MISVPQFKKLFCKILNNFTVYNSYTMHRLVLHAKGNMKQRILAVTQLNHDSSR